MKFMSKVTKLSIFIINILLLSNYVFASPFDSAFNTLQNLLRNLGGFIKYFYGTPIVRNSALFVISIVLFYSIYYVALDKIPFFKNQIKHQKIVAFCFSAISSFGFVYLLKNNIEKVLTVGGVFAVLLISILVGVSVYYIVNGSGGDI
jgi:uncharacterized BrkB/YihY/UPF0761 family membrane protein